MTLKHSEGLLVEKLIIESLQSKQQNFKIDQVVALTGDASTRQYFRAETSIGNFVVCLSSPDDQTMSDFLIIQKMFLENDIRVPHIFDFNKDSGYYLEEDLGDITLLQKLSEISNLEEEKNIYTSAIDSLIKIHGLTGPKKNNPIFTRFFDEEKYTYEISMTNTYFINKYLKQDLSKKDQSVLDLGFNKIIEKLVNTDFVVTHRDYHSRNIMCLHTDLAIIDFQDARMGIPQYDLVSLLEDCYYDVNKTNKEALKKHYWETFLKEKNTQKDYEEFLYLYDLMTVQRVYKAIGSFAYIYETRDDDRYLKYIGKAFEKVKQILHKYPELSDLRAVLTKLYYES